MPDDAGERRIGRLAERFDAVLLDFYGTVVHEDDAVVAGICRDIAEASPEDPPADQVAAYWWQTYSARVLAGHGASFAAQRVLEHESLVETVTRFGAAVDASLFSERMYAYWQRPDIFDDARRFLERVPLPVLVVSNIDRRDIEAAIAAHGLRFDAVLTSEDVRSYKPRPELFLAAADTAGVPLHRLLHVGDSVTSDVAGASALGIPVAWVNRSNRRLPDGLGADYVIRELTELLDPR